MMDREYTQWPLSGQAKTRPPVLTCLTLLPGILALAAVLALVSTSAAAATKEIRINTYPWPENVAITHVWKELLEKRGYKLDVTQTSQAISWTAVARGDVDIDFEAWLPVVDKEKYEHYKDKISLIGPWFDKAWQGLAVPDYLHIQRISQLGDIVDKFRAHGGALIHASRAGSVVTRHAKDAVKKYDLPFKVQASSESSAIAVLRRAYDRKAPVVITLWKPHWAWAKYHMHMLKDPRHAFAKPSHIYAFVRKGFKSSFPHVSVWLANFHLTEKQLAQLMVTVRNADSPEAGAHKWIANHPQLTAGWFETTKTN